MDHRLPGLALLLLTAGMLLVCGVGVLSRPVRASAIQGTEPITYRVNVNRADVASLCLLPRIGPGIAQRIIDDRQDNGPFQDAADLARVPMVGQKTVDALRPWVSFDVRK